MLFPSLHARPLNDSGVPPFAPLEADEDVDAGESGVDPAYERDPSEWLPIDPETCDDPDLPVRFIDGSIVTRTVAEIVVAGRSRPVLAAAIAAAALRLEGRTLVREADAITHRLICVHENDMPPGELGDARDLLRSTGIALRSSKAKDAGRDFDSLRSETRAIAMGGMEEAEKAVLLRDRVTPTLVDGLLERRLAGVTDASFPAFGLVKRQIRHPLPAGLHEMVYRLRPGQRSPAFLLAPKSSPEVPLVSFYLRLSAQPGMSPSYGIVRVAMSQAYLDRRDEDGRWRFLSRLAAYLLRLRQRDLGYGRAGISIEPIVRVEDHLRALRPPIETLVARIHRLLSVEAW